MIQLKKLNPENAGREARELGVKLHRLIVGQDEAIEQIANVYQMYMTGLAPAGRPIGNFLFLGPTGSGKTRMVEAAAESLLDNARAVIKIDCAELHNSHEIAKLVGSPPGYLGHRETRPLLCQETLDQYHTEQVKISFVLFDEIEKASDALWNLLLGILDKAVLTLGDNRRVDFSRAMIFMTSNLGAAEMSALAGPRWGFATPSAVVDEEFHTRIARSGTEAARRKFAPEFINRLDKVVVFKSLGTSELRRILDIELNTVQRRVIQSAADRPFLLTVTGAGKQFLLEQGTDLQYGARYLKRAIERLVVHPLSNLIATGQIRCGDWIHVDHAPGADGMIFLRKLEGLPVRDVSRLADNPEDLLNANLAAMSAGDPGETRAAHVNRV